MALLPISSTFANCTCDFATWPLRHVSMVLMWSELIGFLEERDLMCFKNLPLLADNFCCRLGPPKLCLHLSMVSLLSTLHTQSHLRLGPTTLCLHLCKALLPTSCLLSATIALLYSYHHTYLGRFAKLARKWRMQLRSHCCRQLNAASKTAKGLSSLDSLSKVTHFTHVVQTPPEFRDRPTFLVGSNIWLWRWIETADHKVAECT
ncbi:hypothetical protein GOP47_0007557 [Adiantum capillus-veneris]|uniref:Uncharacterized protein n=1 Tax=Adiantum capillus-veneris TaxID=13818 RepID=A0A9D4V1T3_ADICA|nr:hypothetical protein GOP47_0007557 [Adiantum capillus-veneris]